MAEREGFEPSIGVTYTPLAGARLQPLGHLSAGSERLPNPVSAATPRRLSRHPGADPAHAPPRAEAPRRPGAAMPGDRRRP